MNPRPASDVRIYTASRVCHAHLWLARRDAGWRVISTWIDEAGPGQTASFADLWSRCIAEAAGADALIVYRHHADEILKGALIEVGAALAAGRPVHAVGMADCRYLAHPLVCHHPDLDMAFAAAAAGAQGG